MSSRAVWIMLGLQKSRYSKSALCSYRFIQPVIRVQVSDLWGPHKVELLPSLSYDFAGEASCMRISEHEVVHIMMHAFSYLRMWRRGTSLVDLL